MQLRITAPTRMGGRLLRVTVLVAVAFVAMMVVTSQAAHASSIRRIKNAWLGSCVGVANGMRAPDSVHCGIGSDKSWVTTTVYTGVDMFKNAMTSTCLDDSFTYGLRLVACNGLGYQEWHVTWHGAWAELKNHATGRCLEDSTELSTVPCTGASLQRWQFPIV